MSIIEYVIIFILLVITFNPAIGAFFKYCFPSRDKTLILCVSEEKLGYGDFVKIIGVVEEYPNVVKVRPSKVNPDSEFYIVVEFQDKVDRKYYIKGFNIPES